MSFLTQKFYVSGYLVLIFLILLLVVFFLARNRTKRIKYLEYVQLKVVDDNIAFVDELKKRGLSDKEIQELRDKYQPENSEEDNKRVWQSNSAGEVF